MDNESITKQEVLKQGQQGDFWQIICGFLEKSKEYLRNEQKSQDLKSLPAEEYKLQNELLMAKIEYLDMLKDYPNIIIGWLQNPNQEEVNWDVYDR